MAKKQLPKIEDCTRVSSTLKTLSHPHRLLILCHLLSGPRTVGELEERIGAAQSAVSQFLARMRSEKILASHRKGQFVYYEIADERVRKLIMAMTKIYRGK